MLDWIISISLVMFLAWLTWLAHSKIGTIRPDGRAQQFPWRLVMIGAAFGIFLVLIHVMNLLGVSTGPENAVFGRR